MDAFSIPINELLPHQYPMILIDSILSFSDEEISCSCQFEESSLFVDQEGHIQNWLGLELMSQCAAIGAGLQQRKKSLAPQIGYLISVKHYQMHHDYFDLLSPYIINAKILLASDTMSTFTCEIIDQQTIATAQIGVYVANPDTLT